MPSSKGNPTDPKLREQVKKEVQSETNKDGSGKGQWSAWKSAKLSKEYEKRGGDYENEPGSKNEPRKGVPEEKPGKKRQREVEGNENEKGTTGKGEDEEDGEEETKRQKKSDKKVEEGGAKKAGRPKKRTGKPTKAAKVAREGTRRSARIRREGSTGTKE
ncbi:hypothetical protein B0J12DRAFT_736474 [Macrophomina phaseolina]|uniref:Uncharacterized protein n=1 Tax=Macrophomina phaseolina TaxID=35725 RepID=A0ABQ8GRK2_9PEZI|nr:hypothetical protein B0J12DRAFT_736474 [Macrophomina phaseolina]